jgi:ABC-type phosphate/phosphonate transport system ATPase subunit
VLRDAAAGGTLVTVVHHRNLLPALATRVIGLACGRMAWDLPLESVDDARLDALYRQSGAATTEPACMAPAGRAAWLVA